MHQREIRQTSPIEPFPEVAVEHLATGGGAPALALPARQPLLQPVDQIAAVGADHQIGMPRQIAQVFEQGEGGRQLHPVVGGGGIGTAEFPLRAILEAQQRSPAPRPWVAAAGPVTGGGHNAQRLINHWLPLVSFG